MSKALLIFSGGQDSTTLLGWAKKEYDIVEAVTFMYGQKHEVEIEQSKIICRKYRIKQYLINIDFLSQIVDSALTTRGDVSQSHARLKHLPASFVPNRNAIFITLAHALAQKIGAEILITGVCETDYSGYPDCRAVFIDSIQKTLHLASDTLIHIVTPLMKINKAQTFQLAENVGILDDVIELSHTCYNGDRTHRHDWGYGCGECPACKIRQEGWLQYKTKMAQGYIHK